MSTAWIEGPTGEMVPVRADEALRTRRPRGYKPRHRVVQDKKVFSFPRTVALAIIGSLPILSIPLHTFGVVDISITARFVVAPAFVAFIGLCLFRTLETKVALRGVVAGLVAVALYDIIRLSYTLIGVLDDFFPPLGGLILGSGGENFLVGYLWRVVGDGGGIAVVFFLLTALLWSRIKLVREHMVVFGIAYGVFVWCGLIATVLFSDLGAELLFEFSFAPAVATFIGHVVYGSALGGIYLWFSGKRTFRVPHPTWAIIAGALVVLGFSAAIVDIQAKEGLAQECIDSDLEPHDGSQNGPRCVSLPFGEVAAEADIPQLLITEAPETVSVGEDFNINISTRNLVRDIFLPAGDDLYYVESAELNDDGLTPGHVHMACRLLPNEDEAPVSDVAPDFFVVNDDGNGGRDPDEFTFEVSGIETPGTLQCSAWAGDISHRIPMQVRANQTPAFDSVRIEVG